jgi:hypothetical protein
VDAGRLGRIPDGGGHGSTSERVITDDAENYRISRGLPAAPAAIGARQNHSARAAPLPTWGRGPDVTEIGGRMRAACRNRTDDLLITSEMLYRLS